MTEKHMTKKQLKEDPFFEEIAHIIGFFQKKQKTILIIGIILIIAIGGFFGNKVITQQKNTQAVGYFGIAMDYYNKNNMAAAEDQFNLLAEQYGTTDWGKRGYYYLGLISRKLGQPEDESVIYFETFVSSNIKDDALKTSAYQLIGTYYYRNGDALAAGENYLEAAKHALVKTDKLAYGIRAAESYIEIGESAKLDAVLNYLTGLDLDENELNRINVLANF